MLAARVYGLFATTTDMNGRRHCVARIPHHLSDRLKKLPCVMRCPSECARAHSRHVTHLLPSQHLPRNTYAIFRNPHDAA